MNNILYYINMNHSDLFSLRQRGCKRNDRSLGSISRSLYDDDGKKKKKSFKQRSVSSLGSNAATIVLLLSIPIAGALVGAIMKKLFASFQTRQPSPVRRKKVLLTESCKKLPHIYWINLDESKERRQLFMETIKASGVVNQHRVVGYDGKQAAALIDSKELIFHPQIKVYAGNGERSYLKHPDNIYVFTEAACLLSHLDAIKQAYDSGRELAFIAEDDASFSGIFCDEFHAYLEKAPEGWKVLQFATNNPHVVQHGSLMSEPFISWQRYHHSTRAYLINRAGMETLMEKVHSTNSNGSSVWRVQEFPSVVADETVYSFIGDTYYSTGLWVDTSQLDSTIQTKENRPQGRWQNPYLFLEGKERDQIKMKKEVTPAHFMDRSLLVVMTIGITSENQIDREIEVISQDTHALCKFHRICEWEVNVIATEASLATLFGEASSVLPPYVHIHTKVESKAFNKFLFAREILSTLRSKFDLVLFKDNDQRINGFPWRTFVENSEKTVLSAPLRSTQRDHVLSSTKKKKSQDVQFHDANHWLFWYNARKWHSSLFTIFENIQPIEVPFLESYFVLMDIMFAKDFFDQVLTSDMYENPSSIPYVWCKAAYDWDRRRPSCKLIPLVSTHEDNLNAKAIETRTNSNSSFEMSSIAADWRAIVGKQHTILEMEQLCLKKLNISFVDRDAAAYDDILNTDIIDCAEEFIKEYSPPLPSHKMKVESSASAADAIISKEPRLEFVHITKTGGSSIEYAGATIGINWGSCHYMEVEEVGCSSPDIPYEAPDYQSYALTSPWHTPPKLLKAYQDKVQYPYNGAVLFTVVRNPYSRVLSEYYCPWNGFQPKYLKGTVHDKDPNNAKVMNKWVKSMVGKLGDSLNEFNNRNRHKERVVVQTKGVNEDKRILAQKHYINQAEYVYDGDETIVEHVLHYENLSTEFHALMKKYGIEATLPPKQQGIYSEVNESRLSYKELDPEAIALINDFAKADFEKFGYQMVESKFQEDYSLEATI